MDQSTHDVRRTNCFIIITECHQKPANISVKQWLADNSIKKKAYYYWLRKFCREACEQMQLPTVTPSVGVSFAGFHIPVSVPEKPEHHSVATIRANGITLEITGDISEPLMPWSKTLPDDCYSKQRR